MKRIEIDINKETIRTDFSWQEGIGADHAAQFKRFDMIEQLRYAHEELGFKRVRFHGVFDDDMWTVSDLNNFSFMPGGHKVRELNFRQIGQIYDNILSVGVKPFVELSFMPSQLAQKKKTGLKYGNNISKPKDWEEWRSYIRSFISFLIERYGKQEVKTWYFEVWNEPDLKGFFDGNREDYFKLYEVTARAVKEIDSDLMVGGPSTSACKWIDEFIAFCQNNDVPFDFISTHHYPGDAFGNAITPANYLGIYKTMKSAIKNQEDLTDTLSRMFFDPEKAAKVTKDALVRMDEGLSEKSKDHPVFLSEWNSMAIYGAPVHDEKYAAAFIIKSVLDLQNRFHGYFFWCLSDIYEELLQLNKPFFGGFGILNNDGIPKPSFWAFKLLSQLYDKRIAIGIHEFGEVEYAVFRRGDSLQILLTAQNNDPSVDDEFDLEIVVNHSAVHITEQRIDEKHCNPKEMWKQLGSPANLRPQEVEEIRKGSQLVERETSFEVYGSDTIIRCHLKTNDTILYKIELGD